MDSNLNNGFTWGFSNMESPGDKMPLSPMYASFRDRLTSLSNWPACPFKEDLARLGYYFAQNPSSDTEGCLICFCCGWKILTNTSIFVENVCHHNHCNFIRSLIEEEWVKNLREIDVILTEKEQEEEKLIFNDVQKQMQEENKRFIVKIFRFCRFYFYTLKNWIFVSPKFSRLCTSCKNGPTEIKFYPCLDTVLCIDCSKKVTKCPVCLKNFTGVIRHYNNFEHIATNF